MPINYVFAQILTWIMELVAAIKNIIKGPWSEKAGVEWSVDLPNKLMEIKEQLLLYFPNYEERDVNSNKYL